MQRLRLLTPFFALCLMALPIAPAAAAGPVTVTILSGDGQYVPAVPNGTTTMAHFGPLSVVVKDVNGKLVAGASVAFACVPNFTAVCLVNPVNNDSGLNVITNASGIASMNGTTGGGSANVFGAAGSVNINATSGTSQVHFILHVGAAPVPTSAPPIARTPPPALVPTSAPPVLARTSAPPVIAALPPVPALTISSGDNQHLTAPRGSSYGTFAPLAVLLVDAHTAKPMPNVPVTFTCNNPLGTQCYLAQTPSNDWASHATASTDQNGIATLKQYGGQGVFAQGMTLPFTVTAAVTGTAVNFHLAVVSSAVNTKPVAIVSGDGQTKVINSTGVIYFDPLSVLISDANGKPIPNAGVGWRCPDIKCQVQAGGGPSQTVIANSSGIATLNYLSNKSVAVAVSPAVKTGFDFQVIAAGSGGSATFLLHVVPDGTAPPAPVVPVVTYASGAKLVIDSGNVQRADRVASNVKDGTATFAPLAVRLTSVAGAPIAGGDVTFHCDQPYGVQCQFVTSDSNRATFVVKTDANGIARLNQAGGNAVNITYAAVGPVTLTANYGNVTSVPFTLTITK